jgi:hypothetical protein
MQAPRPFDRPNRWKTEGDPSWAALTRGDPPRGGADPIGIAPAREVVGALAPAAVARVRSANRGM